MTDLNSSTSQPPLPPAPVVAADDLPSLASQLVASVTRHGFTYVAGILGAHGLLAASQQDEFISLGVSVAMAALALGWSYIQKRDVKKAAGL